MTKNELHLVQEALMSAYAEFDALIDDDVYVPSGQLLEQLHVALQLVEEKIHAG